jgi:hypothetical protein
MESKDPNENLFDNSMIRSAMKGMSPEQLENYKKIGEEMYGNVDFVDSKIVNSLPLPMSEAVAYVIQGLKSGLHPKDMDPNEILLLNSNIGEKWYEEFGYTKDDIPNINIKS